MLQTAQGRYQRIIYASEKAQMLEQIEELTVKVKEYEDDIQDIRKRLQERSAEAAEFSATSQTRASNKKLSTETEQQYLIRMYSWHFCMFPLT